MVFFGFTFLGICAIMGMVKTKFEFKFMKKEVHKMGDIIKTITDLLGGIPVIGDIIKMIMGMFGGESEEAGEGVEAK